MTSNGVREVYMKDNTGDDMENEQKCEGEFMIQKRTVQQGAEVENVQHERNVVEIVSPTSSSSSNGSHPGGLYNTYSEQHIQGISIENEQMNTNGRIRGHSDENELQFGEMEEDDDVALRNGRLSLTLDFDRTAFSFVDKGGDQCPVGTTRNTSSSFSDLGDIDDCTYPDTTPNGTPNTHTTFRSLYEAHVDNSSSISRSFGSSMSSGYHMSPQTRGSNSYKFQSGNTSNGRLTPIPRSSGVVLDETQPIGGNIYPEAGEILFMEAENAAYIIFYKCDDKNREGVSQAHLDDEEHTNDSHKVGSSISVIDSAFTSRSSTDSEISSAFSRPPRSMISLGEAGHKVRTTNCYTRDYATSNPTRSLGRGLFRASTSVGSAFLKGAAGLVHQTYQGGANGGVFGFAKGLGMGMLGLGTHTVKGAFRGVGEVTNVVGEMVMGTATHFSIDGGFVLTNYRIIWISQSAQQVAVQIPLSSILTIESSTTAPHVINIECKNLTRASFAFRDESTSYEVLSSLWDLYNSSSKYIFARIHYQFIQAKKCSQEQSEVADPVYSTVNDYERLKLIEHSCFQLYDNTNYVMFPSYPASFVIPSELDEEDLSELRAYRSASRIPAVVWRHPHTSAIMCRCAQPCAGLSGYIVEADQKYVAAVQRAVIHDRKTYGGHKFHFFDARSQIAATANSAQGKGTEDPRNYPNSELHFCDIANIHAVRSSFSSLSAVCQPGEDRDNTDWNSQLQNTLWLMHISRILSSTQLICQTMCQGESVMVHCSDGWDRTPQLTGLVQLLLDPHYRTLNGIVVLIEKEWCSFGHMFRTRYSQGEAPGHQEVEEQSPVFVQWLDSVWQIWRQQPWAFEFSDALLAALYDHVYSGLFGTFLYNCERERKKREAEAPTRSLWTLLNEKREEFVNADYDSAKNFNSIGIILPFSTEENELVIWDHHLVHADPVHQNYS